MSDIVISVEHLSKRYTIQHQIGGDDGLRHAIHDLATAPMRWLRRQHGAWSTEHGAGPFHYLTPTTQHLASNGNGNGNGPSHQIPGTQHLTPPTEEFWALKDVSFEVKRGEVVGIIGRNGAGKSTLFKILSNITDPTSGRARIRGRVASLLEVGTGFHPELTGRENIFLNGAILGMSRAEIRKKFDEIVAFAEVEQFLDTPVKRYSSGMYVRLAFAIAAHLEPEILIVDEVLAVGDAQFQTKCLGKMQDVAQGGRTVLIVSHNMAVVKNLCSRAIVLVQGSVSCDGTATEGIQHYLCDRGASDGYLLADRKDRKGNGKLKFNDAYLVSASGTKNILYMGEDAQIVLAFSTTEAIKTCNISIHIENVWDQTVLRLATRETAAPFNNLTGVGTITCTIPQMQLLPGRYSLLIAASVPPVYEYLDHISQAFSFEVVEDDFYGTGKVPEYGIFFAECHWQCNPS